VYTRWYYIGQGRSGERGHGLVRQVFMSAYDETSPKRDSSRETCLVPNKDRMRFCKTQSAAVHYWPPYAVGLGLCEETAALIHAWCLSKIWPKQHCLSLPSLKANSCLTASTQACDNAMHALSRPRGRHCHHPPMRLRPRWSIRRSCFSVCSSSGCISYTLWNCAATSKGWPCLSRIIWRSCSRFGCQSALLSS